MFRCRCGWASDDEQAARDHIIEYHTEEIDNALMEYLDDAITDVYEERISES